nr:hypothetical protein 9 [Dehalococcoidia bacterium]
MSIGPGLVEASGDHYGSIITLGVFDEIGILGKGVEGPGFTDAHKKDEFLVGDQVGMATDKELFTGLDVQLDIHSIMSLVLNQGCFFDCF